MDNYEFLCCKCGKIPEILKVHTDNSKIEFNCKSCGIYEILVDNYFDRLFQKNYYKNCSKCRNKGIYNKKFFYCENCKINICEICKKDKKDHDEHTCKVENKRDHYFFNRCVYCENKNIKPNKYYYCLNCKNDICEECKNNCETKDRHQCIDEIEKKFTCLEHNIRFNFYCFDCQENFCEVCENLNHTNHKYMTLEKLTPTLVDDRNEIIKINKELDNLVDLNETILNYTDIFEYNEDYLQSIINIGKSFKEGNERNSKDIKCLLKALGQDIQISQVAIESLIDKRSIQLYREEKYIHLNNRKLDDQDFIYISQIRFNQLKEIDISENAITSIEPFKKMRLPFLEFLNLSYNQIKFIKPLTKLKSEKLKYIFLQHNKIEDIEALSESDFQFLKILRAEDYNFDLSNKNDEEIKKKEDEKLKKVKQKYSDKFIFKSNEQQIKEFKNKYELDISCDIENIDLSDVKGGDNMLKKLFLIITYKPKNKIKNLSLRNNDIKNPSLLNKINFNDLEVLDLAVNYIKDLTFLLDIKAKNLKYLYLDNNNFKEIYQILKAKLPNLEVLSLNENDFESEEMEKTPIYLKLEQKEIEGEGNPNKGNQITIQLEKEKSREKKKKKKKDENQIDTNKEKSKEENSKVHTDLEKSSEENPQEANSNLYNNS